MSDFLVERIVTFDTQDGPRLERVGGTGWVDTAARVAGFIESGAHRFTVQLRGQQLPISVQDLEDGGRELVVEQDGALVPLTALPLPRAGAPVAAPPPTRLAQRLARFFDAGSRM